MANTNFDMEYPAFLDSLKVGALGAEADSLIVPDGIVNITPSWDPTVVTYYKRSGQGFQGGTKTGNAFTITVESYHISEDAGQKIIAATMFKFGKEAKVACEYTFGNGDVLTFNATVKITRMGGGATTDLAPLNYDLICDGKPTFTPAVTE